ncbi:MAG: hypothetical protein LBR24_00995, partial [Methanobrevibacter sp.]|nr:hypothetical protein [Methanobrevibacter sp.]
MNVTIEQNKIDMSLYDEYFDRLINLPKNLIEYFQKGQNIAVDTNKEEINNIYLKEIKSILNTAENIQEALKKDHMNIIEYYNFAEIKRMLENTLLKSDISEIDEENLTILIELISKLKKINDLKFKLLK